MKCYEGTLTIKAPIFSLNAKDVITNIKVKAFGTFDDVGDRLKEFVLSIITEDDALIDCIEKVELKLSDSEHTYSTYTKDRLISIRFKIKELDCNLILAS